MAAMLPWRRSKFILVAEGEGGPAKGKSLGPGLSYCALLANLLRACPDLWPECPLERLAGLFRSKRQTVELNKEDPVYTAWYLGNAVTLQARGEGCTDEAVEKIWAKSDFGGRGTKMKLSLGLHGLRMSPAEKGSRRPAHAYLLHRITACGADPRRPKVFAWVYRHQVKNKAVVLRCHAVLLSRAEKAHAVARLLRQASRSAFNEFKRLKKQDDARHLQRQLLGEAIIPLVPLRRLLNCKCPYRPPPDRNRSAPRLSAIQEEEEEEEEEGEEKAKREGAAPPATATAARSAPKADWIRATGVFCSHSSLSTVAGTMPARFSLGGPESARVVVCAPGPLSATSPVAGAVAACLSFGAPEGPRASQATLGRHEAAACLVCKPGQSQERPEVLSLVRELRFCTLRGPLPHVDTLSPWQGDHKEPSCLPC